MSSELDTRSAWDEVSQVHSEEDPFAASSSADDPLRTAYDRIYRETLQSLTAMLRKSFGNGPPEPEDIAQQAYQRLLERARLDDIRNVEAFLWRTARNLFFNEQRRQVVRSRYDYELEQIYFPEQGFDSDPERVHLAEEQIGVIQRVLLAMPERRRRAFVLHRIEGLSIAATGRALKISATAAGKHIAKAMADIDRLLAEDHD